MAPSYSDVDEVTGTLQTFQCLSDVEIGSSEMSSSQCNGAKYGHEQKRRSNAKILAKQHTTALSARQRKISDVSDTTPSDSEDGVSRASFDTRLSSISSKASKVDARSRARARHATRRTTDLSLSSSGVSDVDESVEQRRKTVENQRQVDKKWRREAAKTSKSQHDDSTTNNNSCNRDCTQCKRRQMRLPQLSSEASTDLGISTSDIDDKAWSPIGNTTSEVTETDSEVDKADEDTLTRKLVKAESRCQVSKLYSRVEAHHCKICCDIDVHTSECEFCGLDICDSCCGTHFSMHIEDVKDRLERLRKQAVSISQKETRRRLMTEINETVLDLTIACNTTLDRAIDVYRATASISTSFIGSLVDRRIKISNSLKYLLRQIPRILTSDDLYELMYFIKVAKSVHERMEELQVAIGDPRSGEVFKLVLTNAFSSINPLFEQNSLLLPLSDRDRSQGHPDVQSKSDGLQKASNVGVGFVEVPLVEM